MLSGQSFPSANFAVFAADGLIFMLAFLFGTYVTWWAVGILKWDKFVHDPFGPQARMLRFILGTIGGFVFALVALLYVAAVQVFRLIL